MHTHKYRIYLQKGPATSTVGPMSATKLKFNITEAKVKDVLGDRYNLDSFVDGVDYVRRKCFKSYKLLFREDILPFTVVDPSLVEHKQEPAIVINEVVIAKVTRKYPNTQVVETNVGQVRVGKYGANLRVGQVIKLKDNKLVIGW